MLLTGITMFAQEDILRGVQQRVGQRRITGGDTNDSLRKRDHFADSITIKYLYLDSTRFFQLDSSVNDFTTRYPIPATHIYLGNTGTASRSILFDPLFSAGWDPGF